MNISPLPSNLPDDAVLVTRTAAIDHIRPTLDSYYVLCHPTTYWNQDPYMKGNSYHGRYIVPRSTAQQLPSSWKKIPCHPPTKPPRGWRHCHLDPEPCRHIVWDPLQGGWVGFKQPPRPIPNPISHVRVPLESGWTAWYPEAPLPPPDRLVFVHLRKSPVPDPEPLRTTYWDWNWYGKNLLGPGEIIAYQTTPDPAS